MASRMKTWVIIGSVAALFVAASFARELYSNYQVDREIEQLRAKQLSLEQEKISISELKDRLSSQDFLEGEARLKLGLKKPGETAIIIPESQKTSMFSEFPQDEPQIQQNDTFRQWLKHFFD